MPDLKIAVYVSVTSGNLIKVQQFLPFVFASEQWWSQVCNREWALFDGMNVVRRSMKKKVCT